MSKNLFVGRLSRALLTLTVITSLLFLPVLDRAQAAQGDLDTGFGSGGKVNTDFVGGSEEARGVAIQPDGKIVAAGYANTARGPSDFAVVRYNRDGSLDTTFGNGGRVNTDFFDDDTDQGFSLALQPDGRIVVAGLAFPVTGGSVFALLRYNGDGSLDTTFGPGGKVTTNFVGFDDMALSVALQADGKIIAAGGVTKSGTGLDFALARYNADGSLDQMFGDGGTVTTDFANGPDRAFDLLIQPGGKIVVGGFTNRLSSTFDFGLARYNTDGSLDQTFGTGGKTTLDFFGSRDVLAGLAQLTGGKIIAVGTVEVAGGGFDFGVARFSADGFIDHTFGSGGKVSTDFFNQNDLASAVEVQRDGKIIVAGVANIVNGGPQDFALARFTSNGHLDPNFGAGGKVTTDFFGKNDQALSLAIQRDGRIVAAGTAGPPTINTDFALARYESPGFDICLQDDNSANSLMIDSTTGDYQFSRCGSLTLSGTGVLTFRGCTLTLQHSSFDRRIMATINICSNVGTASIQPLSQGARFNITDRNTTNNSCACQ